MQAFRTFLCLVMGAASAQAADVAPITLSNVWVPVGRSSLGLSIGRSQSLLPCGSTALLCDSSDRASRLYANAMIGRFWGVELGYVDMGRIGFAGGERWAQGLNLSLVGKAPLAQSLDVFGKLGTTYGRAETSILGGSAAPASDQGFGLSYSAGVSFAFTPRLSATLVWDSNDLRLPGGNRDPVRSTSLGLQYRY